MRADTRELLATAKRELDQLHLYPTTVRLEGVRIVVCPWLFRLPVMRRFAGYTMWRVILLRQPAATDPSLVVHELCHVWQMQHHPIRMPLSYLRSGYRRNRYEREARRAAGHPVSPPH